VIKASRMFKSRSRTALLLHSYPRTGKRKRDGHGVDEREVPIIGGIHLLL